MLRRAVERKRISPNNRAVQAEPVFSFSIRRRVRHALVEFLAPV
jgi:hypothetical protein